MKMPAMDKTYFEVQQVKKIHPLLRLFLSLPLCWKTRE